MHLILFDIDGTLIRGRGFGRRALERAFRDLFGVDAEDNPVLKSVPFAGNSDPRIIAAMARALGIAPDVLRPRLGEFEAAYLEHLRITVAESDTKEPCPGVPEVLESLRADPRLMLGLLTGNVERGARIKLEPFGFNRYFPFGGFGSDDDDRAVMARHARERAEARARVRFVPRDVLVIGDTASDVGAGRANEFLTVGVATGSTTMDSLRDAGATAVFADLSAANGFENWLLERWNLGEREVV
jgi:phosphoglycolate phosphatase-like HAD superfamily hydrolase